MKKKAQAEIIVIVGILLLALVVIYYAVSGGFQPSPAPQGVAEKQKAVRESLVNLAGKGADRILKVMEEHGGYPTRELLGQGSYQTPAFVVFNGEGVPYWARCQNNLAPSKQDVEGWFGLSLESYIRENIGAVRDEYRNVTFDLSRLAVSVRALSSPDRVEITVNLPTKVDGYSMPGQLYPYKTALDSKLGEILDFAGDFSQAQSSKRFLEVFTTASIYLSNYTQDDQPMLPTGGFLTGCGQTIYRTPEQISAYLKEIANYVVTQTLWWQSMPVDSSKPKVYAINRELLGREYMDLKPDMFLPDDFSFDVRDSIVITNTKVAFSSPFWKASGCPGVYTMKYSVSYPVIVRVKDSLSGNQFNFAVLVFINNMTSREVYGDLDSVNKMMPGRCEDIREGGQSCQDLSCYAKIYVEDQSGAPLPGAVASFGGCGIGASDEGGKIEGKIKCGLHELSIYRNSNYSHYIANASSSSMNGTYNLSYIPALTINFRKVSITERGILTMGESESFVECNPCYGASCPSQRLSTKCVIGNITSEYAFVEFTQPEGGYYIVTNVDPTTVPEGCGESDACRQCNESEGRQGCEECAEGCRGGFVDYVKTSYIPSGSHEVSVKTMSSSTFKETGGFVKSYTISPEAAALYINIPEAASPAFELSGSVKGCLADRLRKCGMDPVSQSSYPRVTVVAERTCEGLRSAMEQLKAECPSVSDAEMSAALAGCSQYSLDYALQMCNSLASRCNGRVVFG